MKKNKSFENKSIKKQYIKLISSNMIAFLLVFIALGLIVSQIVNKSFFTDLENDLYYSQNENTYHLVEDDRGYRVKVNNARILTILYDSNKEIMEYSSDLIRYIKPDFDFRQGTTTIEEIEKAIDESSTFKLNDKLNIVNYNEKIYDGTSYYTFMTLSYEVKSVSAPDVTYCKFLIMIDGELDIRDKIINVYLFASAILIALGAIASIILSSKAIKPIGDNLNKQLTFVSDASHELRTPLAIVQSKLENILTKKDSSVMDVSEDIAISLKEVSRLSKLTSDLLLLAKSDNDTVTCNFTNENVKEVLLDTIMIFKEMAELENRTFNLDLEDVQTVIDKEKIVQLLIILLDNAFKYTNENDNISVTVKKEGSDCFISVSDTGIGISEETKKKIFERFYREDKARSRMTGGNGLGLAIAKTIVFEHNGRISVDHNEPKGTKFMVYLPIRNKK